IWPPRVTVVGVAVFVIVMSLLGHVTVVCADAESFWVLESGVPVTVAVFVITPQTAWSVVCALSVMVADAPAASEPIVQFTIWLVETPTQLPSVEVAETYVV